MLTKAGVACGERVWPFPMDEDFDEALRSDVADVKQCAADGWAIISRGALFEPLRAAKDIPESTSI